MARVDVRIESCSRLDDEVCRRLLADSDPWRRLGYGEQELTAIAQATHAANVLVAMRGETVVGFCLSSSGVLLGEYLKLLVVDAEHRGQGIGGHLLRAMEDRAFRRWPNVYLCVSDFNESARRFYERHGYREIGRLPDLLVAGSDEILMRKTTAPWRQFRAQGPQT